MNASATLRRGDENDRAFVTELGRRTVLSSVSASRDPASDAVEASFERLLDFAFDRGYVLFVAEDDLDGPIGFVLMLDDVPDEVTGDAQGFVAYMAVDPDARRRGVGAALLDAAERAARERGLPYMSLMVTEENEAARELYAQAGYRTERRLLCKPL